MSRAFEDVTRLLQDGRRIAFETDRTGNWETFVMNIDGSGRRNITNHPAVDGPPRWRGGPR